LGVGEEILDMSHCIFLSYVWIFNKTTYYGYTLFESLRNNNKRTNVGYMWSACNKNYIPNPDGDFGWLRKYLI
jgi:hypothetical protein